MSVLRGGDTGRDARQIEVRLLAERARQPDAQGAVVAQRLGATPAAQADLDEELVNLRVERLELRQAQEARRRGLEVVLGERDLRTRAERLGGKAAEVLALSERPIRVRVIGEEVVAV